ncbi:MAG: rRNA maturation RNase YbeY [Candidatus Omnitrophota bacterium]
MSSRCFVSIAKSGLIKKNRGQRNRQRASRIKINIRNLQKKILISPAAADKIKKAVLETCVSEKKIGDYEITICLVKDNRIKELNLLYMGKCVPTDVLSFDITMPNSRHAKTIFADIVVSTDTAINNAKVFQTTPSYELLLYVIHGILHILGYDDKSMEEKQVMQDKAESILRKVT